MELNKLLRENIKKLEPYACARNEFSGEARVFLDANENPYNAPYNRYPDPLQHKLKEKIVKIKGCREEQLFLGNGSDEAIDIVFRAFCEPGKDNMVRIDPSYGMYQVCAEINDVEIRAVSLDESFQISAKKLMAATDDHTKLMFLCSPNNPTSNLLDKKEVIIILKEFNGLVILDEAYIDFSPGNSFLPELSKYNNLIIFQTFSKAWGMAGIRLGMAFAAPEIIAVFNKIKYPYNVNILTQKKALESLNSNEEIKETWVKELLDARKELSERLKTIACVNKVYPSDSNFLLVKMDNATKVYRYLTDLGIIVRNRSGVNLCNNCLRITVGSEKENDILIRALKDR